MTKKQMCQWKTARMHGNQFLSNTVNKSYRFIRTRDNIMPFKGSFALASRLYMRVRLSAVLCRIFGFCRTFLLWILHLSTSKSTFKSRRIDSIDHSISCMMKQLLRTQHFTWNIIMPFSRHTFTRLKSSIHCTDTCKSWPYSPLFIKYFVLTNT